MGQDSVAAWKVLDIFWQFFVQRGIRAVQFMENANQDLHDSLARYRLKQSLFANTAAAGCLTFTK
jgi:hypothetical protein